MATLLTPIKLIGQSRSDLLQIVNAMDNSSYQLGNVVDA